MFLGRLLFWRSDAVGYLVGMSVRKEEAGNPALLTRLATGLLAQA